MSAPEPWLRGPIAGIPPLLQPAAHALVMAWEDVSAACADLSEEQFWTRPGSAASVGFHVAHLAGSTDRLLTYARGEGLGPEQLEVLSDEQSIDSRRPSKAELLKRWEEVCEGALRSLAETDPDVLLEPRAVGRAGLPSNVLGLLFHAAEHASRHTGQVVTTARVVGDT